jgi:hypothetical protein
MNAASFLHGTRTAAGHHDPLSVSGPLVAVGLLVVVVAAAVVLTRGTADTGDADDTDADDES